MTRNTRCPCRSRLTRAVLIVLVVLTVMLGSLPGQLAAQTSAPSYHSPWGIAYSPDGTSIAVSDATAAQVVILSANDGSILKTVKLNGEPRGLVWSGGSVLVAEYNAGTVAVIDAATGQVSKRLTVGPKPVEIATSATSKLVAVTEYGLGKVIVVNQDTGAQVGSVAVANYPFALDVTSSGSIAVVGHLTPSGDATKPNFAAAVSLVSLDPPGLIKTLALPQGSSGVRGVRCSPDGKWAYVTHLLGRTTLATPRVLRGWLNSNALSIIDLGNSSVYATVLLDRISEGAADPWGVSIAGDGSALWVTISGAHQVIRVDLKMLHELVAGRIPTELGGGISMPTVFNRDKSKYRQPLSDIWFAIARDPTQRALLQDDLGALWGAGILKITRLAPSSGPRTEGPRGIALSPQAAGGKQQLAVAAYFAGKVAFLDADSGKVVRLAAVGTQPAETPVRQGERLFFDASSTLQHWLSCNTCHPDARADGRNWVLPFGGTRYPRSTKSLVYAPYTPPLMAHGAITSLSMALNVSFKALKFSVPSEEQLNVVGKYLESLTAEVDPYRINGQMTEEARKGKALFAKAGCDACHTGPYFTDMKMHDVGTKSPGIPDSQFDTPTLLEMWRTAPYLHDGSAATMKDLLTTANKSDQHGKTSQLTPTEINELAAYVLQLPDTDVPRPWPDGGPAIPPEPTDDAGTPNAPEPGDDAARVAPSDGPVPRKATSAGCSCDLGGRPTGSFPLVLGLVGAALFLLGRRRRQGAALVALVALCTLAAASQRAQAAAMDLKDPQFASLDKILVIKRPWNSYSHIVYQYYGHQSPKGGLFILENVLAGAPTERDVLGTSICTSGPHKGKNLPAGAFLSPDLSYDAKEILFAYADTGSKFHIFKVNVDGTGLTQLTEGDYEDFDPVWLPDDSIMFVSTRRGGYGRSSTMTMPVYTLYAMNRDGTEIHPVSLHEANEWNPSVDNNGMIVYSRWDHVDRGAESWHYGWLTTPDGLDPRAMGSNYAPYGIVPNALLHLRAIPDSNKFVGTAVAHHAQSYGSLVLFDPDIEDDDGLAQYTRLTPDAKFPETEDTSPTSDHKYATPWPIDEDHFLCVADPSGKRAFGVYLIDGAGNKTVLKSADPDSYLDPIPLAPRPRPLVVPKQSTAKPTDAVTVTLLDVYDSLYPWPDKTEIKDLRIVQIYPKTTPICNTPRLGHGGVVTNEQNGRGVLGTVPVEADGSAKFLLPPGKPVYFQALDANGVAIQSMMSDAYAVPGSTELTCQGCHEPRHRTARPGKNIPIALLRSPTPIQPEPDGANPMSFPRLIQPILDKHCNSAGCHATTPPVLSKGSGLGWSTSYKNLESYLSFYLSDQPDVPRNGAFSRKSQILPVVSVPGKINGAKASKLYPLLKAGHYTVSLTPQELRSFALWLDNNSDFYSQSYDLEGQREGKTVPPKIE